MSLKRIKERKSMEYNPAVTMLRNKLREHSKEKTNTIVTNARKAIQQKIDNVMRKQITDHIKKIDDSILYVDLFNLLLDDVMNENINDLHKTITEQNEAYLTTKLNAYATEQKEPKEFDDAKEELIKDIDKDLNELFVNFLKMFDGNYEMFVDAFNKRIDSFFGVRVIELDATGDDMKLAGTNMYIVKPKTEA